MKVSDLSAKFEKTIKKVTDSPQIHEAVLLVENADASFSFGSEYGGKGVDSPLLMASITKLFAMTCILILREQGKLSFDDKLTKYFDGSILDGLHIYGGKEYSREITIYDLIFQTSGLPDAYEETSNNLRNHLINEDAYIGFEQLIAYSAFRCNYSIPRQGRSCRPQRFYRLICFLLSTKGFVFCR